MAKRRTLSNAEIENSRKRVSKSSDEMPSSSGNTGNLLNTSLLNLYSRDKKNTNDNETSFNGSNEEGSDKVSNDFDLPKTLKKLRTTRKTITLKNSSTKFTDVGGMDHILEEMMKICMPMKQPMMHEEVQAPQARGILLHGPPGCGKTLIARAVAGELEIPLMEVSATELVCGISGESESKIRDTFDQALRSGTCFLFIDGIDVICPRQQTAEKEMEKRLVTQLKKSFSDLNDKDKSYDVKVIGATSVPDSMDPTLRSGDYFGVELPIGMPNEEARLRILKVLCEKAKLSPDFDLHWIAHNTPGYVGADLKNLTSKAVRIGYSRMYKELLNSDYCKAIRCPENVNSDYSCTAAGSTLTLDDLLWLSAASIPREEFKNLCLKLEDFQEAAKNCTPYSKREGFAIVPNVTWADVGALDHVKEELRSSILQPVKLSKYYEENGIASSKGILLYGPKGCGKTLLAKAIANECSINFLAVNGPELLNMYVGESEKAVRRCFERARNSAPCVIFFDEIDALCPSRTSSNTNAAVERVVTQLLTEMDGVQERKQVFVIAATNRLERIDSAMLRPGRLEKVIFIDLPSAEGRVSILDSLTKNRTRPKIAEDLDFKTIAHDPRCEKFSGADLAYLIREATTKAMNEIVSATSGALPSLIIQKRHFDLALEVVKPSFNDQDRKQFRNSNACLGIK